MKRLKLGDSEILVSKVCLGTMIFGGQVDEKLADKILNYACENEINFIDTAEMYPIPDKKEKFGVTEKIIGSWLKKSKKNRDQLVIASKVSGPSRSADSHTDQSDQLSEKNIIISCEASLRRLNTDYIDLYQIHWPGRHAARFGNSYFDSEKVGEEDQESIETQLYALDKLVRQGKVRAIGLSNETPYGVHEFISVAKSRGYTKISSVQNPYCLIGRMAENGLDEMLVKLGISFLGYSPLAFGLLTGKYDLDGVDGLVPQNNSRLAMYQSMRKQRWGKSRSQKVSLTYNMLARELGMKPAQMALAFCYHKKFVGSTVIGVSNLNQLKENIDALSIELGTEILSKIDEIRYINGDPV